MESLRKKNIIHKNSNTVRPTIYKKIDHGEIDHFMESFDNTVMIDDNSILDKELRLGKKAKTILYVLSKINQASLQFLVTCTMQKTENIFPVLQRLEDNKLIYGYDSPIRHRNARGRWYRPKHYRITNAGKIVSKKIDRLDIDNRTERIMAKASKDATELKSEFYGMLNIK